MTSPAPGEDAAWGRTAAGCLILARRTGRFLFGLRAKSVPSGGTWSLWGGKTEDGETPMQTAVREVFEETGLRSDEDPVHIHRLSSRSFVYDTFLLMVDEEFCPVACKETAGYAWLPIEDLPSPTHWGLDKLLSDREAVGRIVRAVESSSGRSCPLLPRRSYSSQMGNRNRPWRPGAPLLGHHQRG